MKLHPQMSAEVTQIGRGYFLASGSAIRPCPRRIPRLRRETRREAAARAEGAGAGVV